jgi:hypothetical protein
MSATPSIVIGKEGFGIKNGNLLGYYRADDGIYVARQFTATRGGGTNGTFVNSSGLIEVAASPNLPRIDFSSGSKAVLIEPAATNLASRSEEFDNASWFKVGINTTGTPPWVNVETAPNGTMTADKIIATAASGNHYINRAASTQTGQHTFSVFAKAAEYGFIRLQDINAGKYNVTFDLINGTATGTGASIENYGNGWYRCIVTYDGGGANVANGLMGIPTSGTTFSYTGDGTSGIFVWGAQLETGAVATSYIPTTTGTITRNADVITFANASEYIGQTEGTLYAEVDYKSIATTKSIIAINDGTADNRIQVRFASTTVFNLRIVIGGASNDYNVTISPALSASGSFKVALAYKQNDYVLAVNGSLYASTASRNVPACTNIILGNSGFTSEFLNDRLRAAAIYPTRLSDAQLIDMTWQ